MPRIYTSANDPLDFCQDCFPTEEDAMAEYGNVGDGPDRRGNCFGWDAEHPSYDETDYLCMTCKRTLTEEDNFPN